MDSVEAEGSTIDDAIASALHLLGTTRDRVDVEILRDATRGFLGFGARKARVRATRRAPLAVRGHLASDAAAAVRIDTDRGGSRPDVGGTAEAASVSEGRARQFSPIAVRPRSEPRSCAGAVAAEAARDTRPSPSERVGREAAERAAALMREVIRHLGLSAVVTLERTDDGQFLIDLSGDASGILIGRRGQMLDALEYLMNRVVAHDGGEATRIIVDVENYRARRREALESMARRSAERAKEKQKPVTLNPMNPRDRRIVHMALQNDATLVTRSAGEGYLRKLVIVPAGVDRQRRGGRRGARP